ncbi:MAG: PAS domain-containing sensor histidine kinase [Candidatus Zixiibacteriota bacterium]|nr:MAG: PAS domain-containing sensor histidine kinase [candidate division Zixibacteria bacterium]
MTPAAVERGKKTAKHSKCAVFKIDRRGRFVYVDDLTEKFLASSCEELYGKSIKDYLDEKSMASLRRVLDSGKHYETFYRPLELVVVDAKKQLHLHTAVVSLNFVAGNPANYQVILIPETPSRREHIAVSTAVAPEITVMENLFEFMSKIVGTEVNWDSLAEILLEFHGVRQTAVYRFQNDTLHLLGSATRRPYSGTGIDLSLVTDDHLEVARAGQPFAKENPDPEMDSEFCAELTYPLAGGNACWGILRLIHSGENDTLAINAKTAAGFLGNVLYAFGGAEASTQFSSEDMSVYHQLLDHAERRLDTLMHIIDALSELPEPVSSEQFKTSVKALRNNHRLLQETVSCVSHLAVPAETNLSGAVDLNRVFRYLHDRLSLEFPDVPATLQNLNLPVVTGDETILRNILYCILNTSLQMRIPDTALEIDIQAEERDGKWHLYIFDNGYPVSEGYRQKIFRPCVDSCAVHADDNVGLRLAVAKALARRLGGDITLSDRGDAAKCFEMTFALIKEDRIA